MMFRDDLFSVLDFGWDVSRRAWRLLSPGQEVTFTPESAGLTGRDMDQLAFDLRRQGHGKPARLAFSAAFVLNGLASQTIPFDQDLTDKLSQIVAILAEMLLELEANFEITTADPVEIVEVIQHRWGLVLCEDPSSSEVPRPHFRSDDATTPAEEIHSGLIEASEELVWASEILLKRVMQDGEFPYTAALSRIHHLGATIRDRTISLPISQRISRKNARPVGDIVQPATTVPEEIVLTSDPNSELFQDSNLVLPIEMQTTSAISSENFSSRLRHVLVIDGSPFFRMLLTTAIEAAGYPTRTVASLAEAQATCAAENWDLVVCEATESSSVAESIQGATVIGLTTGPNVEPAISVDGQQRIQRTDLSGLLALIKTILGPVSRDVRLSA